MSYFIKVSLAWLLFLLLFELLYKGNGKFTINRLYLLSSIVIGLSLPFIPSPSSPALNIKFIADLNTMVAKTPTAIVNPAPVAYMSPAASSVSTPQAKGNMLIMLLGIIYAGGALIILMKYLIELFGIVAMLRKNPVQLCYGQKVICTGKNHSPYSFMNYIFLTDISDVDPKELEYIIQHETAHNSRKHWLDLWLMQLLSIVFWFHPLIWRYRFMLRLQHEYEADAIAAAYDPYNYGRFILQQTLLCGVPSITHSFHFSPIKNRIHMLTKLNGFKSDNRKYLLLLPALLACTFIMAESNTPVNKEIPGNKMSFNGNILTWRSSDTLYYDRVKGKAELVPASTKTKPQVIVGFNNEPVYNNDYLQQQAVYGNAGASFADYVKDEFYKLRKNSVDSQTYLADLSIVVDKKGKVIYYNAQYARPDNGAGQQATWGIFYNWDTQANARLDKVIANSPIWKPALNEGKPVNSFIAVRFPGC